MDLFSFFGRKKKDSKNVAKERLKLVLVQDRSDISPKFLELIRGDMIKVVEKYAEIDIDGFDIKVTRMKRESDNKAMSALVANIPIVKTKDIDQDN